MATLEITEFVRPAQQYGSTIPVRPMPSKNASYNTGDVFAPQATTHLIRVLPSADMRMAWTGDGSVPADPTGNTSYMLLKANVEKEFYVETPGLTKAKFG